MSILFIPNSFSTIFHSIFCMVLAMVFINFSVQFNNYTIKKIISVCEEGNINGSNIDLTVSGSSATEEHNEESNNENTENNNHKSDNLHYSDLQQHITAFSSSKNHFVMADFDEYSLEIPSPPPWNIL